MGTRTNVKHFAASRASQAMCLRPEDRTTPGFQNGYAGDCTDAQQVRELFEETGGNLTQGQKTWLLRVPNWHSYVDQKYLN